MTEFEIETHHKEPDPTITPAEINPGAAVEHGEVDFSQEPVSPTEEEEDDENPRLNARSGSSPPEKGEEDLSRPGEVMCDSRRLHQVTLVEEDQDLMEYETGLLDDLEDEDEVITFATHSLPVIAKPIVIAQTTDTPGAEKTGGSGSDDDLLSAGRLRSLSMNGHLTLNLQPLQIASPSSPSRDGSSSPTMGRFKVTTCHSDNTARSPPQKDQPAPADQEPTQTAAQAKDERLMTPIERLQMYIDNPTMACRSGVAVQYVNFIKDAEDPEVFVAATARLFDRLIQDQELSVRTAFLENIPSIVRSYKPSFKRLRMMAFLGESIRDDNYNVRRLAQVAIGQLIDFAPELMTRETITASVVPLLIQIFYAESTADLMIDALNLFCKLLDKVGPDPVRRLFIPEFNKLCSHDIAQIRQVCAQNLVFVVRYFTMTQAEEFHENDDYCRAVQERIIQLSQDFAWHVRETVASVFPQVIDICHKRWPTFTARNLYPAYAVLLADQAKQVRRWATRGLGRVIATNAEPSKTRLHLTNNGTVEFVPPTSYRFSDSDLAEMDSRRMSPSISENILNNGDHRGGRTGRSQLQVGRALGGALSSPVLSHSSDHPRRNYYNRLGIVTSLNHAFSEAEEAGSKLKNEERPDFNCFRFWQNPIPEVAVTDTEGTPLVLPEILTLESLTTSQPEPEDKTEDVLNVSMEEPEQGADFLPHKTDSSPPPQVKLEEGPLSDEDEGGVANAFFIHAANEQMKALGIQEEIEDVVASTVSHEAPLQVAGLSEVKSPMEAKTEKMQIISPDSDDTRSVSSASSTSQDLSTTFTVASAAQTPFASSYEIDPFIIEKHKRRDRAVMLQLKDSGEVAARLEDILPNVQFLREFLLLAKDSDRDTVTQVAVDFPAVAFTVGRQFWPEIQECHRILATNNVMQARELIAASLPRIAEIIGYYHTVVDLVPLVNEFLKDTDSVRLNMIENYSAFIMRMPPEIRPLHLLRLCEFFTPDEERNWRYRYACAEQIAHLALLFPPKLVVRNLMDGAWFFARDRTAEVRKNSTVALSSIFMRIEQQRDLASRNIFLQKVDLFLRNEDFRSRQVFAQFCEDLLCKAALSFESFSLYFGDRFWPLFDNQVVAVRLAAARCLIYIPDSGRKQSLFGKAMERLQRDPSRTIQEVYQSIVAAGNMPSAAGN